MSEAAFGIRINWFGKEVETGTRKVYDSFGMLREEAVKTSQVIEMSAKQQSMALRQVPMQFTDIVTSLAAGQSPMMVLMQQGGQLKDSFGGIGPAASALGGYVAGLVNPLTVAAAAAVGLGVAIAQGAAESDKMRRSIIMTGDSIGVTYSGLKDASDSVAESTGKTRAAAAEAVAALVSSGRVGVAALTQVSEAVVRLDAIGEMSIKDSVKVFQELGQSPVEASVKLNQEYHYLTETIYKQIKALQDHGREEDAAALAQKTFADAMTDRAKKIQEDLGVIETAWNNAKAAAKGFWDAALDIGRDDALSEKLKAAKDTLNSLKLRQADTSSTDYKEAQLAVTVLEAAVDAEKARAQAKEEAARKDQAGITWAQQGVQVASNRVRREQEIAKARQLGLEAGRSEVEIEQRIAQIREKYKDPVKEKTDPQKAAELFAQYERENNYALEKIARSSDLALLSERERAIAEAQYKVDDEAQKLRERIISSLKSEAEEKRALAQVDGKAIAQKEKIAEVTATAFDQTRTFEYGWTKTMQQFADDSTNYAKMAQTGITTAVDAMSSSLANFATTGKFNVASLFTSLLSYMIKVQMMAAASSFMTSMFGGVTGTPATSSTPTSAGTYTVAGSEMQINALPNAHGNVFSGAPSLSQYSNSLLTGPTFFSFDRLHAFANGGAMGVAGEAGTEAVMPLTRIGPDLGVRAMINFAATPTQQATKIIINTYNQAPNSQAETRQQTSQNGDIQIDTMIVETVAGGIRRGGSVSTALESVYGLKRVGR